MAFLSVLAAAAAGFVLGGLWFGALGKPWLAAAGLTEAELRAGGRAPFAVAAVAALLSAGMLRHVFAAAGVAGPVAGLVSGLGVGLFLVAPWIAMNYAFARRPAALSAIDGGYVVVAYAAMGLVLGLF